MSSSSSLATAAMEATLAPFLRTGQPRYRTARWLKSDFESAVWEIHSDSQFTIHWSVKLADGSLLTEPQHSALLEALRAWPIARTHADMTGGLPLASRTERKVLQRVLYCIDYLLLHTNDLNLLHKGFDSLTANDMRVVVAALGRARSVFTSVYDWPQRLTDFLRCQIRTLPACAIDQAAKRRPALLEAPSEGEQRITSLTDSEIVAARAWLETRGWNKFACNSYQRAPCTTHLAEAIYSGTLVGRTLSWPVPLELCFGRDHQFVTEYPRARVHSEFDDRMNGYELGRYIDSLASLQLLQASGLKAPTFAVDDLRRFARSLDTKSIGRFRTLPQSVVFSALRTAVEFTLEHGDGLIDSYLAVAKAAHGKGLSIVAYSGRQSIEPLLTPGCRALGVRDWTIEQPNAGKCGGPIPLKKHEWFRDLRENRGLFETIYVLYGAIQVVIGTLMARRLGELVDLKAGSSLDTTGTRLLFRNRKSGFGGLRELEARPIPGIGARLIRMLERLQAGVAAIGIPVDKYSLFSPPLCRTAVGLTSLVEKSYAEALDLFCDWHQSALDQAGNRYYVRQHQLRRFFAMLFFWGGGFGGMDALRWFLGQADVQHLWHYITESVPGATIRTVAAEWAVYGVVHATPEAEVLGNELAQHFGTSDFSILEEEALVLHLEDLMEEGRLTIEPQFLDGGRSYRIAVVLRGEEST